MSMDTPTPGTPYARLKYVCDYAVDKLSHNPLRSDKAPEQTVIETLESLQSELAAARAELAAATGLGTPYARLKLICDYAVEKLGHDPIRSDKAPEQTVIEVIESQRAELALLTAEMDKDDKEIAHLHEQLAAYRARVAAVLRAMFTPATAENIMKRIDAKEGP